MNIDHAISFLAVATGQSPELFNKAISAIREDALDSFIATQFKGGDVRSVEVDVAPEVLARLFERIQGQWVAIGEREPYASVLADEKYLMANIGINLAEFRSSGVMGIQQLEQLAKKNGVNVNYGDCLELGCGVGRLTAHFAKHFRHVTGIDISPGNLRVCEAYVKELGLQNTELKLMRKLPELDGLEGFDAFVSFIAIQHNAPPIQKYILDTFLAKLRPGGVFLFQTIVNAPGYGYSAEGNFYNKDRVEYEMHCLPMQHVLQTISRHGLTLLDIVKDRQGGWGIDSFTFFGIRPVRNYGWSQIA
jgi:2-polyprenyl-3-methyl-5-hydroxy-6-metoxy-1,4-benzoquinol methylase